VRPETYVTIGHSTRTAQEFVALLREARADVVVDVRTVPRSRTNPQFNADVLPATLTAEGIGYEHVAELGGLRGKQRSTDPSPNQLWRNESFRNYADYALTDAFRSGLARLRDLGRERVPAVMCAEAVWWRCHRRIIADYLLAAGCPVLHVLGAGSVVPASMTPGAQPASNGIVYPGTPATS
jgi:uncharacterized protein (DUF488 family)